MGDSTPVTTAVKPTNIRNNNKGFTILQWNACGLTSMGHGDELKAFISNSTIIIDIMCSGNMAFQQKENHHISYYI